MIPTMGYFRSGFLSKLILALGFLFSASVDRGNAAVPRRSMPDEQIVAQGRLVGSGGLVEIYEHGVKVDPSFLGIMEDACEKVEAATGLKLDTAALGPRIRVYVSEAVQISHVWKGYDHPSDPKAIMFLNPRVYSGAMSGKNATHIHELTHLFTWRYHSHTLREGLADYIALMVLPGAAVGPNPAGRVSPEIPTEIRALLGTTRPPPAWVSTDPVRRSAYYFAGYRFVKYLIEMKGMETFRRFYASGDPESEIKSLYGIAREGAVEAALKEGPDSK